VTPVTVTHYTDPWSVWCWAIEPQLLRLRERHGPARIQFQVRLGAILETPVPRDFPRMEIVRMFGAARRQSGMPLDPEIVLRKESGTTNRAGIAAKAVALADPERAATFLRAMRYAALVEGRDIEELDVQEEIALATDVDVAQFREALESDEATREFYGDQAEARVRGITGFPTVTFRGAATGQEVGVAGFQPTEAYEAALARVSGGARWVEDPPPDLRALLRRAGPLATAEVAEVLDLLEDAATLELVALEAKGAATKALQAGGYFWDAA
jgi:predicted DsbA family dithiol-disulfide isomerase